MVGRGDLKLLHPSWDDIQRLSEAVAAKVMEHGYEPDLIVAVSRGGFDPARIMCDQLMVRRLASVQVEYYNDVGSTTDVPRIIYPLNADVNGLKILVVDDVSDTGTSLKAAKEHVESRGATEVRVATLHIKPWTTLKPDYHAAETDAWIVYPWEPIESMLSIAAMLKYKGLSPSEIKEKLMELGFDPRFFGRLPHTSSKT
ncbi:MAG: phosphoribosyltransferase [Candidatus Bathyarchaeota archaeon]|nr:MAG: phosphoribosyltransferase [Candidatus Bathyarchaeota archaeon]